MATMFRDFSFDPASPPSYSAYEADRAAMNVSPTSKPESQHPNFSRPPTPPCTIGDLASKLNHQTLRIGTRQDGSPGPPTPPSDDCTTKPLEQPHPTYSRVSASLLRMQRQSSARMQCSSSHVRDISRLVRMIEEEEQCTINETSSRTLSTSTASASTASDGDEGIDMNYDIPAQGVEALIGTSEWRAGERGDNSIRVTKTVRMRKRSRDKVEKRRSK